MDYCCSQMKRWSQDGVIHHSRVNNLPGIHVGENTFVTIAVCPWCGSNVSMGLDKQLIGKRIVEVRE